MRELDAFRRADRILAYMDFGGEVRTRYFVSRMLREGRQVALPRVEGSQMRFYPVRDLENQKKSSYGIPEPTGETAVFWDEAFMIMPGVAFDRQRRRIGYGGGYYDRFLADRPSIFKAAVAFSFQIFEEIPCDERDVCPDCVVTERDVFEK